MNQEKIGQVIKEIRTKNNLSQQSFAEKFGVTYQAVSKWENGKNIPDIATLKEICKEYNLKLEDLLDAKISSKPKTNLLKWFLLVIILLIIILIIVLIFKNNDFEFKTLSTSCNDFTVNGSIAYNDTKSSIYISHITYCGEVDSNKYKKIQCVLYESNDKVKTEIGRYNYEEESGITLEEFLKEVNFNVETCKLYSEDSLHLEIDATTVEGEDIFHKVPLKLVDNCID